MRVAFAGTAPFAAVALEAILQAGHAVPLVLTQPDRPAGRGLKPRASAVSELASARGLSLLSPGSLRADPGSAGAAEALDRLRSAVPDLLVVAAYGLILPQSVLDVPSGIAGRSGVVRAVNIHASLLPRWRGAEPVACSLLGEGLVKIWSAEAGPLAATADPGTVVSAAVDGVGVACGDGVLMIHELQRAGGRRLRAREFLAGTPLPVGTRWQTPTAAAPR